MRKIFDWLMDSHHYFHLVFSIIVTIACGIIPAIIVAIALEYKDYAWGGKFDFEDIGADLIGIVVGTLIRFLVISNCWRLIC